MGLHRARRNGQRLEGEGFPAFTEGRNSRDTEGFIYTDSHHAEPSLFLGGQLLNPNEVWSSSQEVHRDLVIFFFNVIDSL